MRHLLILTIIVIFAGCSSENKAPEGQGNQTNPDGKAVIPADCREKLDLNIVRCFEELRKSMPNLDSNLVFDYCDCVNKELVNLYSCEQIKSMKKLSEEQLLSIYKPIKEKCMQLYLRNEIDRIKFESMHDTL